MLVVQCYDSINVWIGNLKTSAGQEISQGNVVQSGWQPGTISICFQVSTTV